MVGTPETGVWIKTRDADTDPHVDDGAERHAVAHEHGDRHRDVHSHAHADVRGPGAVGHLDADPHISAVCAWA